MAGTLVDSNAILDILTETFIGAHSAVAGLRLLTRDGRRYRTYFPSIEIITPART